MTLSSHVLDTQTGRPAAGLGIRVLRLGPAGWVEVARGVTDGDGRTGQLVPPGEWVPGRWRVLFDIATYDDGAFFPEVTVDFLVAAPADHHHVPLLLARHGYTTYRGS